MKSTIIRLPRGLVDELKTAIELSDMDKMAQVVAAIGVDHGALAKELKELVDAFQFDRLLALLDGTENAISESQGEKG